MGANFLHDLGIVNISAAGVMFSANTMLEPEFVLKIHGFSPDTLPMTRLAAYMAQFGRLLGHSDGVIFKELREGSAALAARSMPVDEPRIEKRIFSVKSGAGPEDARAAYAQIDKMLVEDKTWAETVHLGENILEFPGSRTHRVEEFVTAKQYDEVSGIVHMIGGKDESINIHLRDAFTGAIYKCTASKAKAREMAKYLFADPVRIFGDASWKRDASGCWKLNGMNIDRFTPLSEDPFDMVVARLRAVPGNEWSSVTDPGELLAELRGANEE